MTEIATTATTTTPSVWEAPHCRSCGVRLSRVGGRCLTCWPHRNVSLKGQCCAWCGQVYRPQIDYNGFKRAHLCRDCNRADQVMRGKMQPAAFRPMPAALDAIRNAKDLAKKVSHPKELHRRVWHTPMRELSSADLRRVCRRIVRLWDRRDLASLLMGTAGDEPEDDA